MLSLCVQGCKRTKVHGIYWAMNQFHKGSILLELSIYTLRNIACFRQKSLVWLNLAAGERTKQHGFHLLLDNFFFLSPVFFFFFDNITLEIFVLIQNINLDLFYIEFMKFHFELFSFLKDHSFEKKSTKVVVMEGNFSSLVNEMIWFFLDNLSWIL